MSTEQQPIPLDDIDKLLESVKQKTPEEEYVAKTWPNLPSWILMEFGAKGWMWLSANERESIISSGTERPGNHLLADYSDY